MSIVCQEGRCKSRAPGSPQAKRAESAALSGASCWVRAAGWVPLPRMAESQEGSNEGLGAGPSPVLSEPVQRSVLVLV